MYLLPTHKYFVVECLLISFPLLIGLLILLSCMNTLYILIQGHYETYIFRIFFQVHDLPFLFLFLMKFSGGQRTPWKYHYFSYHHVMAERKRYSPPLPCPLPPMECKRAGPRVMGLGELTLVEGLPQGCESGRASLQAGKFRCLSGLDSGLWIDPPQHLHHWWTARVHVRGRRSYRSKTTGSQWCRTTTGWSPSEVPVLIE